MKAGYFMTQVMVNTIVLVLWGSLKYLLLKAIYVLCNGAPQILSLDDALGSC